MLSQLPLSVFSLAFCVVACNRIVVVRSLICMLLPLTNCKRMSLMYVRFMCVCVCVYIYIYIDYIYVYISMAIDVCECAIIFMAFIELLEAVFVAFIRMLLVVRTSRNLYYLTRHVCSVGRDAIVNTFGCSRAVCLV